LRLIGPARPAICKYPVNEYEYMPVTVTSIPQVVVALLQSVVVKLIHSRVVPLNLGPIRVRRSAVAPPV